MSRSVTVFGSVVVKCDLCEASAEPSHTTTANWTTMTRGLEWKVVDETGLQLARSTYKVFVVDLCGMCSTVVFDVLLDRNLLKNLSADGGTVSEQTAGLKQRHGPDRAGYFDVSPRLRHCGACGVEEGGVHLVTCHAFQPAWRQPPDTNPRPVRVEQAVQVVPPSPRQMRSCVCGHEYSSHIHPGWGGRCTGGGQEYSRLGTPLAPGCTSGCHGYIERPEPR